jgi:hypothetical protein
MEPSPQVFPLRERKRCTNESQPPSPVMTALLTGSLGFGTDLLTVGKPILKGVRAAGRLAVPFSRVADRF